MKLVLLIVLVLIATTNANFLSRSCECKAVSHNVHLTLHKWDISSCKFCSCQDSAMTNCEAACKSIVENYAKSGCGKMPKNSKIIHSYDAGSCGKAHGTEEYQCA